MNKFTNEELQFLNRLIKSFNEFSNDMFDSWSLDDKDKAIDLLIKIRKFIQESYGI